MSAPELDAVNPYVWGYPMVLPVNVQMVDREVNVRAAATAMGEALRGMSLEEFFALDANSERLLLARAAWKVWQLRVEEPLKLRVKELEMELELAAERARLEAEKPDRWWEEPSFDFDGVGV